MGVGLHARRDPQQHHRSAATFGGQGVEAVQLVEAVHHDAPHPGVDGVGQLGGGLVVAVQHESLGREPGGQGHVQLAAGSHVEVQTLVAHQLRHGAAEKRLGRIGHSAVAEDGPRLTAACPYVVLVVDDQRRTERTGQVDEITTRNRETAGCIRRRAVGEEVRGKRSGHGAPL